MLGQKNQSSDAKTYSNAVYKTELVMASKRIGGSTVRLTIFPSTGVDLVHGSRMFDFVYAATQSS